MAINTETLNSLAMEYVGTPHVLPYLKKYCRRIRKLMPGDIISYRWGRAKYAHLAIYLGGKRILHCQARSGVEITDIDAPYLFDGKGESRVTGYWRVVKQ